MIESEFQLSPKDLGITGEGEKKDSTPVAVLEHEQPPVGTAQKVAVPDIQVSPQVSPGTSEQGTDTKQTAQVSAEASDTHNVSPGAEEQLSPEELQIQAKSEALDAIQRAVRAHMQKTSHVYRSESEAAADAYLQTRGIKELGTYWYLKDGLKADPVGGFRKVPLLPVTAEIKGQDGSTKQGTVELLGIRALKRNGQNIEYFVCDARDGMGNTVVAEVTRDQVADKYLQVYGSAMVTYIRSDGAPAQAELIDWYRNGAQGDLSADVLARAQQEKTRTEEQYGAAGNPDTPPKDNNETSANTESEKALMEKAQKLLAAEIERVGNRIDDLKAKISSIPSPEARISMQEEIDELTGQLSVMTLARSTRSEGLGAYVKIMVIKDNRHNPAFGELYAKLEPIAQRQENNLRTLLSENGVTDGDINGLLDMAGHGAGLVKLLDSPQFAKLHLPDTVGNRILVDVFGSDMDKAELTKLINSLDISENKKKELLAKGGLALLILLLLGVAPAVLAASVGEKMIKGVVSK